MRRIAFLMMLSVMSFNAMAKDDPVKSFERFVQGAVSATNTKTPLISNETGWEKRKFTVNDFKFDVKKTDSLVNPIIGLVSFHLVTEIIGPYPSRKEVEEFESSPTTALEDVISLTYSYNNSKWVFWKGSKKTILIGDNVRTMTSVGMEDNRPFDFHQDSLKYEPFIKYWWLK